MKNYILILLLLTIFSSILASEEIVVMFNRNYYPFEFVNDEGNPDGFTIDLLYAIAREAALTIILTDKNWKDKDSLLFNGDIDLAPQYLSKNENRSIINSDTLYSVPFSLWFNKRLPFQDKTNLKDRIFILSSGDSSEDPKIEKNYSEKYIRTKSWSDTITALSAGYGDFALVSNIHKNSLIRFSENNLSQLINFELTLPYGFYAAKWNQNLINSVNNGISIIKASGEFDVIYKKWFGREKKLILTGSETGNSITIYIISTIVLMVAILYYIKRRKAKQ